MAFDNTGYPVDTTGKSGMWNYLAGIGSAVLGNSSKFFMGKTWMTRLNARVILIDYSYANLMSIAQNTPHLNVAISKGAEMFSQMKIKHVDKNGDEILNSPVMQLLNNPNPLQQLSAWLYEFYIYNAIYNINFGYKMKVTNITSLPQVLRWLPPGEVKVNLTGKNYRQSDIAGIIENYVLYLDPTPFTPEEIMYIAEGLMANGIIPGSRIEALQIPLSNIIAALKSQNIITTERGLIGFVSTNQGKDADGVLPNKKAIEKVEKDYKTRYSEDGVQGHVRFTDADIKWIPMSFDVKQLMLFEGLEDAFALICGSYGLDRKIFPASIMAPSGLGTSSDIEAAMRVTFQNTMQPLANKLMGVLVQQFGLSNLGENLIADYGWLPMMQTDKVSAGKAFNQQTQAAIALFNIGVISQKQVADLCEVDNDGDGKVLSVAPQQVSNSTAP